MSEALFAALGVVFAAFAVYLTVRLINRRELWATGVAAIAVWNAVGLAVLILYERVFGRAVVAVYTAWFGDIQASYSTFARAAEYFGLIMMTAIATAVSLWFFEALTRRRPIWRNRAVIFAAWEVAAVAILIWSYEVGFPYKIHELDWAIFGPSDDIYSFRNMVAPRVIAWLICTTPTALAALLFGAWLAGPKCSGSRPTRDGSRT
jgi:hypothetical protein